MKSISRDLSRLIAPKKKDLLSQLLPNQVVVQKDDLEALQKRVVVQENQLRTVLGALGVVYLISAPAAALSARERGAKWPAAVGAGVLGPLYLAFTGYRDGLR